LYTHSYTLIISPNDLCYYAAPTSVSERGYGIDFAKEEEEVLSMYLDIEVFFGSQYSIRLARAYWPESTSDLRGILSNNFTCSITDVGIRSDSGVMIEMNICN